MIVSRDIMMHRDVQVRRYAEEICGKQNGRKILPQFLDLNGRRRRR